MGVVAAFFHAWERRLAAVTKDRVTRPFEWGLDWLTPNGAGHEALAVRPAASRESRYAGGDAAERVVAGWVDATLASTERFFAVPPCDRFELGPGGELRFPSALTTPHPENNTVYARHFSAGPGRDRRVVLVLPQWNADESGHVGLCRLLNRFGIDALRLSLPYHDRRMPPELHRADYIVSSNIVRTVQVCRQAVLDARRAVAWLAAQGYERIGILGTSLGSCLAMLTAAHEPLIRAQALNHVSPFFADVVWEGLSTRHVREGLEPAIDLERLRRYWMPISPWTYLDRVRDKKTLLVYAKYDLTFPPHLSRTLLDEFARRGIPHETVALFCGHYSSGVAPFKYLDGYVLCRFLVKNL